MAEAIYAQYEMRYGHELQGCCLLIADEIQKITGGDVVAGELTWYGGSCRRTHWWVEVDGEVLDPMGRRLLEYEEAPGRVEHHRDRDLFKRLLHQYEMCRVR